MLGQTRPTTGATLLRLDLVGALQPAAEWPWAGQALQSGHIVTGVAAVPVPARMRQSGVELAAVPDTGEVPAMTETARLECVPVRCVDEPIAVMVAGRSLEGRRRTGRLERVYRDLYQRIWPCWSPGTIPSPGRSSVPRTPLGWATGWWWLDADGRFSYASPNAMSALHRMGVSEAVEGATLSDLGIESFAVQRAIDDRRTGHRGGGAPTRRDRALPLHPPCPRRPVTGVMVLCATSPTCAG